MKTWYVGTATPSHTGTYMVLETPEGRGAKPYVVHMEGFTGYLSTRFFTSERDWRYTGMFITPSALGVKWKCASWKRTGSPTCWPRRKTSVVTVGFGRQSQAYRDTLGVARPFPSFQESAPRNVRVAAGQGRGRQFENGFGAFELATWNKHGERANVTCIGSRDRRSHDLGEAEHDLEQLYGVTETAKWCCFNGLCSTR